MSQSQQVEADGGEADGSSDVELSKEQQRFLEQVQGEVGDVREYMAEELAEVTSEVECLREENEALRDRLDELEDEGVEGSSVDVEDEDEVLSRLGEVEDVAEEALYNSEQAEKTAVSAGTKASEVREEFEEFKGEVEVKWHKLNEIREKLEKKGLW